MLRTSREELMPVFKVHFRHRAAVEPDDLGIDFRDLHHAYLETSRTIPDTAREE